VEKYCTSKQATDDNMAHAQCMLNTWDCRHTIIAAFPPTTTVAGLRLDVTLCVHCLSC